MSPDSKQGQPPASSHAHIPVTAATGSQRLIIGFAIVILIGTLLLRLPISSAGPEPIPWGDALFTSTSAVTVTGLTVASTATTYSLFGQLVILLLMQVGGVGFITISLVLFQIAGLRVGLQERMLLKQTLGVDETTNVVRLTAYILLVVLVIELTGATLLFLRWVGTMEPGQAAYMAIFHSVSAFCNAGFDLFSGTDQGYMFGYDRDVWTLGVLSMLIVIGGIGIAVVDDLLQWPATHRLTLHTRITLVISLVLLLLGIVVFLVDDLFSGGPLSAYPWYDKLVVGTFTVISSRTAGITIIPLEQLSEASQLVLMVWMFIGGAPSSMAGGVSTSTIAVIAVAMLATVRGQSQVLAFDRAIPTSLIMKAMAVMTVSTLLVAAVTLTLALMGTGELFLLGFESVSAFSNTGYSLGITGDLSLPARMVIAFVMFWGRLGPLTMVVVLAQRQRPSLVTYPEEKVILG